MLENIDVRIFEAYESLCKILGPDSELLKDKYERYLANGITKHYSFGMRTFSFALSRKDKLFFFLGSERENYKDYFYTNIYVLSGKERIVLFGEDLANAKKVLEGALNKAIFEVLKRKGKMESIYSVSNSIKYCLEEMNNN